LGSEEVLEPIPFVPRARRLFLELPSDRPYPAQFQAFFAAVTRIARENRRPLKPQFDTTRENRSLGRRLREHGEI